MLQVAIFKESIENKKAVSLRNRFFILVHAS